MNDVNVKVRKYLSRMCGEYELKDNENIFDLGIVNSLFYIQLILFIEKEFDIEIDDEKIDMDKIRTIKDITGLIEENLYTKNECDKN